MTDYQLRWVYCRPRDEYGKLIRKSEASKVSAPVPFDVMYRQRLEKHGLTQEQIDRRWKQFVRKNPSYMEILGERKRAEKLLSRYRERREKRGHA